MEHGSSTSTGSNSAILDAARRDGPQYVGLRVVHQQRRAPRPTTVATSRRMRFAASSSWIV